MLTVSAKVVVEVPNYAYAGTGLISSMQGPFRSTILRMEMKYKIMAPIAIEDRHLSANPTQGKTDFSAAVFIQAPQSFREK